MQVVGNSKHVGQRKSGLYPTFTEPLCTASTQRRRLATFSCMINNPLKCEQLPNAQPANLHEVHEPLNGSPLAYLAATGSSLCGCSICTYKHKLSYERALKTCVAQLGET